MTQLVEALMQENGRHPNIYERAVQTLYHMSKHGFAPEAKLEDGSYCFSIPVEETSVGLARLLECSVSLTANAAQPIPVQAAYDEEKYLLHIVFDKSLPKPPVRLLRDNLEKAKECFMDCVKRDPNSGHYFIRNTYKHSMDPVALAASFIREGEESTSFYSLPAGAGFTDSSGKRHDDTHLVDGAVMTEYLAQNRPDLTLDRMAASAVGIEPQTMARIIDQLGLGLEKGRQPS